MAGISPDGVLIVAVQATPERGSMSLNLAPQPQLSVSVLLYGLIMTERNSNALRRHTKNCEP